MERPRKPSSLFVATDSAGVFLLAVALWCAAHDAANASELTANHGQLLNLGTWGPVGIILSRAVAAILAVVPNSPILLFAGATEGVFFGAVYVLIGAALGALIAFNVSAYVRRRIRMPGDRPTTPA